MKSPTKKPHLDGAVFHLCGLRFAFNRQFRDFDYFVYREVFIRRIPIRHGFTYENISEFWKKKSHVLFIAFGFMRYVKLNHRKFVSLFNAKFLGFRILDNGKIKKDEQNNVER